MFEDINSNGQQDPGEPGIPDIKVVMRDSNGDTKTLTVHAYGESSTTVPAVSTVIHIDETSLPPGFEQTLVGTNPMAITVPDGGTAMILMVVNSQLVHPPGH